MTRQQLTQTLKLQAEEPWISPTKLGDHNAPSSVEPDAASSLAAKVSLATHLMNEAVQIDGHSFLDVGANQGYLSLEVALRGGNVLAIEPYLPNFKKIRHVFRANGLSSDQAKASRMTMENIQKLANQGIYFDGCFFMGTLYHAEHPYDIIRSISNLTDPVVFETQLAREHEINDEYNGYRFFSFEEGPGSPLDDPTKRYLRQVKRVTVRKPDLMTLLLMFQRAGFAETSIASPFPNTGGEFSDLYKSHRGVIGIARKGRPRPEKSLFNALAEISV